MSITQIERVHRRRIAPEHRLYYIVQSEMLDGGVIEAQVVARLRDQAELFGSVKTKLVFLEPARVALGPKARLTLKAYRRMWPEGDIVAVPFVSRLGPSAAGRALAVYLARQRVTTSKLVFHCRGAIATWSANVARRFLGRGRVIYDVRGAATYETAHRLGFASAENLPPSVKRSVDLALREERRGAAIADFILTVSPDLKRYATEILGAAPHRASVVPSCVDQVSFDAVARQRVREAWKVSESAPVFIYAGRVGPERLPAHMIRVFAAALRLNRDAKLVLLLYRDDVGDLDARFWAAGIPPDRILRESCSRDDVVAQLSGADIGLFFCEPALRFRYCFPIKIPEYLAAGLSLVVNSAAAGVPDLVRSRRLGWILDETMDATALDNGVRTLLDALSTDRDGARARAIACCSDLYLWRRHLAALRYAYGFDEAEHASSSIVACTEA